MVQELGQQEHMEQFWVFLKQKLSKKPLTVVGNGSQKEILFLLQM